MEARLLSEGRGDQSGACLASPAGHRSPLQEPFSQTSGQQRTPRTLPPPQPVQSPSSDAAGSSFWQRCPPWDTDGLFI